MDNPKHTAYARQRGMTLAEVLVATAVFTIIVIAALLIYDQSNKIFNRSVNSADMQQNTRVGFERLVTEVRMAGFDTDRDGVPTKAAAGVWQPTTQYSAGAVVAPTVTNGFTYEAVTGGTTGALEPTAWPTTAGDTLSGDGTVTWVALGPVYQQPDEQIEYAGKSAITIRANLDYSTTTPDHGRELDYEPAGGAFPIVTTGNDEIVTYALRSDNGPNPDTITFYADVARPRAAYPGGTAEEAVEIPNVDLCTSGCTHPPYTLYRFTLDENGAPDNGTPVASNIKSIEFKYYQDSSGTELLTDFDGNAITNGAIGGLGQYDPDDPGGTANYNDRTQREKITSVSVQLQGMTGAPNIDDRTYTLASHITPRNLGLSGMSEPSTNPPGQPTMRSVCVGSCNITRVQWAPPSTGNVRTYEVHYDTNPTGDYTNVGVVVPGDVVSAPVYNLAPGTTYYFKVVAVNENGESNLTNVSYLSRAPVNTTKPGPVTSLSATAGAGAEANQITLTWTAPVTNASPLNTLSCAGVSQSGANIDSGEAIRYRIWRGDAADFDPTAGEGEIVLDENVGTQPTGTPGSTVTWVDNVSNKLGKPPANCKTYYYRIQAYDTCSLQATDNSTFLTAYPSNANANNPNLAATGQSTVFPAVGDDAVEGLASSTTVPAAPGQPSIDYTNGSSTCNRGQNTCDVKIVWPAVTTDMSNPTQTITVDSYRITRERKKASDTSYSFDTVLPLITNASSDASQMAGGNVIYHDTTALDHDDEDHRTWYYRYSIEAIQCGVDSEASPYVTFPQSCGLAGSAVIQSGASSGDGSLAAPWVMNGNDTMEVIPPTGVTLDRVEIEIYPEPDTANGNSRVDHAIMNSSPFVYSWINQSDGQLYRAVFTLENSNGCVEQTERYIQDDPIGCPSATISPNGQSSGGGTEISPWVLDTNDTVTVNNPAQENITNVLFTLTDNTTGAVVGTPSTDVTDPFVFTWSAQTDNQVYKLTMLITYVDGCQETVERFIKDEPPAVCSGATTTMTGASSGDGLAQGTPWLVNGGDVLEVVPPTGGSIISVVFTTTPVSPAGVALPAVTDSTSPYQYTWTDQTDNTIYKIVATITYSTGCTETLTRYVQDQICAGATTTASGSVGAGTGLTSASPWVFNTGDTVTVNAPTGATIQSTTFNVYDVTGTSLLATVNDGSSPFVFTWSDRVDDTNYQLKITVTYATGCSEVLTRYIQDQGKCFVTVDSGTITHADNASQREATITYQVSNPSGAALTLQGFKVTWARDSGHPLAKLTQVTFVSGATSVTQTVASANQAPPDTGTYSLTVTPPTIPAGNSSYLVKVVFDIGKKSGSDAVTDLTSNWITGLCLQYTSSEISGTASCNVLGSTSGNPTACN